MPEHLVVLVCTGNQCRSPMAEYLLRRALGARSGWKVASAGTAAFEGLPASSLAVQVLREAGLDARSHVSKPLTRPLVEAAGLIVTMTSEQRDQVIHRFPEAAEKVILLKSAGTSGEGDVLDPAGESIETYRRTRDEIGAEIPDMVLTLHELGRKKDS